MNKEDFIGTKWKCPWCHKTEKITRDGFNHECKNYIEKRSLEEHLSIKELEHKAEMQFWFGDINIPKYKCNLCKDSGEYFIPNFGGGGSIIKCPCKWRGVQPNL